MRQTVYNTLEEEEAAKKKALSQALRNEYVSSLLKKYGIKTKFEERITYEFIIDEKSGFIII